MRHRNNNNNLRIVVCSPICRCESTHAIGSLDLGYCYATLGLTSSSITLTKAFIVWHIIVLAEALPGLLLFLNITFWYPRKRSSFLCSVASRIFCSCLAVTPGSADGFRANRLNSRHTDNSIRRMRTSFFTGKRRTNMVTSYYPVVLSHVRVNECIHVMLHYVLVLIDTRYNALTLPISTVIDC